MDIVYRVGGDGFDGALFAERSTAERVAQIYRALRESKTWGEFRRKLPAGEWEEKFADQWIDEPPSDDEPFKADDVPEYADGDYPQWLQQTQLSWFPDDLIEKYDGQRWVSVLNGWALDLPAENAEAIADELRARGHTVEPTDLDIN